MEQELVEYCLADDAAREKMQMEPLLAEFYDDTQQEPEKEKRCRRYLAVAGMYFSFSEELARENDIDAMRKGIEVLEKAAGENMEGKWEAVIWQRLADACYLGGKSGDGEREQDWCQESFLYYERLLCSRQDGNRRKNLLRAAELALQFDMQEKQNSTSTRQQKFREWLKEKYGTIEKLNSSWCTTFWSHIYNSFDQIEAPSQRGRTSFMH